MKWRSVKIDITPKLMKHSQYLKSIKIVYKIIILMIKLQNIPSDFYWYYCTVDYTWRLLNVDYTVSFNIQLEWCRFWVNSILSCILTLMPGLTFFARLWLKHHLLYILNYDDKKTDKLVLTFNPRKNPNGSAC